MFTHPLLRVCEHISPGFLTLYFGLPRSLLQVCSQLIPGSLPHSNNPLCSVAGSEPPLRLLKAYQHGSSVEAKSGQCQPRHAHSAACLQAASLPAQVQSCCWLEKEKKKKKKKKAYPESKLSQPLLTIHSGLSYTSLWVTYTLHQAYTLFTLGLLILSFGFTQTTHRVLLTL